MLSPIDGGSCDAFPMSRPVGRVIVPPISFLVKGASDAVVMAERLATTLTPMDEERIGLFIDYENLAIGARDDLGMTFNFRPVADALAERGRVVVRRAYADWTSFEADRRMLSENHVEMLEIPQRKGLVRKNAADIKMAVDAVELAFERDYVTTFVICTRLGLHPARPQAAGTEQAGDRRRPQGIDLEAVAGRL